MAATRPLLFGPMQLRQRRRPSWRSPWPPKPLWRRWRRRPILSPRCPQAVPGGAGLPHRPDQRRRASRCQRRTNRESAGRSNGVASLSLFGLAWMVTRKRLPARNAAGSRSALLIVAVCGLGVRSVAGSRVSSGGGAAVACGSACGSGVGVGVGAGEGVGVGVGEGVGAGVGVGSESVAGSDVGSAADSVVSSLRRGSAAGLGSLELSTACSGRG